MSVVSWLGSVGSSVGSVGWLSSVSIGSIVSSVGWLGSIGSSVGSVGWLGIVSYGGFRNAASAVGVGLVGGIGEVNAVASLSWDVGSVEGTVGLVGGFTLR